MQATASTPKCENWANETLDSQDAHLPCASFRMPSTPGRFIHANLPEPKHHSTRSETYGAHILQAAAACGQSHREMTCQWLVQWPWEVCQDCSLALGPCNGHSTKASSALQAPSNIMKLQPLQIHPTRSQHQPRPLTGLLASLCLGLCFGLALSLCWPANG